ncbi:MAG: hypothetical protein RL272_527 [Candidatus Parcubacteria bacterium]|jgi:hypothetical protein
MNAPRRNVLPLALGAVAACSSLAFAAAGIAAGPAASPRCDRDEWNCSEWGACAGGARTRVCSLAADCPAIETPKPAESERCETAGKGCTADTWVCEDWPRCDAKGNQHRDCRLTVDCPEVQTVKPTAYRACPALQCGDLPSLRERVACRMRLEPSGIVREDELRYLPEHCRVAADEAAKTACIALSRAFGQCLADPSGDARAACATAAAGLGADLKEQTIACKEMDDPAKTDCLVALRKKVYDLVLFRFIDLGRSAEALRKNGVPDDVIVDFSVKVEDAKVAFRAAGTKDDRKKVILDLRSAWQGFLDSAKPYLR